MHELLCLECVHSVNLLETSSTPQPRERRPDRQFRQTDEPLLRNRHSGIFAFLPLLWAWLYRITPLSARYTNYLVASLSLLAPIRGN